MLTEELCLQIILIKVFQTNFCSFSVVDLDSRCTVAALTSATFEFQHLIIKYMFSFFVGGSPYLASKINEAKDILESNDRS